MKRLFLILFSLITSIFAISAESKTTDAYVLGAYNYGIFTQLNDGAIASFFTNSVDISVLGFDSDKNVGIYLNTDYNFIDKVKIVSNGNSYTIDASCRDEVSVILSEIYALAFRYPISDKFQIYSGIGFHFAFNSFFTSLANFSFGLGGDITLHYVITDRLSFTLGSIFSQDFCYLNFLYTSYGKKVSNGFCSFGSLRPYIGLTFKYI